MKALNLIAALGILLTSTAALASGTNCKGMSQSQDRRDRAAKMASLLDTAKSQSTTTTGKSSTSR